MRSHPSGGFVVSGFRDSRLLIAGPLPDAFPEFASELAPERAPRMCRVRPGNVVAGAVTAAPDPGVLAMTSEAFLREHRLLTPAMFKQVLDAPTLRASHPNFMLLARENGQAVARIGFILPKRRVRLAVARNLVKRIIRESFRRRQDSLAGLDIVVMARDRLGTLESPALRAAADHQFQYLAGKWQARKRPSAAGTT